MKILLLFLLLSVGVDVVAKEVWLFGTKDQIFTQKHRLTNNWTIKHFLIDGGVDLENTLSQNLSSDKRMATDQMNAFFLANKNQLAQQVKSAWQGAINAQSLNIEKVPAITFDGGKSVIYGVVNTAQALQIYNKHKPKQ